MERFRNASQMQVHIQIDEQDAVLAAGSEGADQERAIAEDRPVNFQVRHRSKNLIGLSGDESDPCATSRCRRGARDR